MDESKRQVGALETLIGTQKYRDNMQRDLHEELCSMKGLLHASSAILYSQGRIASDGDSDELSSNVLLGLGEILESQAERLDSMDETLNYLKQKPAVTAPGATVSFKLPQRRSK